MVRQGSSDEVKWLTLIQNGALLTIFQQMQDLLFMYKWSSNGSVINVLSNNQSDY
jgi:hypothetical protein